MKKSGSQTKVEITGKTRDLKIFLGAIQYMAKFSPEFLEQTDQLRKLLKRNEP